jgi:hypothetical protein
MAETSEPSLDGLDLGGASSALHAGLEIALTHFRSLLELGEIEQAFAAIEAVPQVFDKPRDCFRLLVSYLLNGDKSLRRHFIELPWGIRWFDLLAILEERHEFNMLFSLHSFRSDYKQAAMVLYRLAQREANLEESRMLLILAKHTLLLCAELDSWFVHEHHIVTPDHLETEIILKEAQQFVLEREPDRDPEHHGALLETLFKYGAYKLAIKLSKALRLDLGPVFYELAQEFIFYQKSPELADPEALQWVDLWLEECAYVLLNPAIAIGTIIKEQLDKERSLQLFEIVCEAILQSGLSLPSWLMEDLARFDISLLIRCLLKVGKSDEALKAALEAFTRLSSLLVDGAPCPDFVTHRTLGSLRAALLPLQLDQLHKAEQGLQEAVGRLYA